jgi:hypothetical protein
MVERMGIKETTKSKRQEDVRKSYAITTSHGMAEIEEFR